MRRNKLSPLYLSAENRTEIICPCDRGSIMEINKCFVWKWKIIIQSWVQMLPLLPSRAFYLILLRIIVLTPVLFTYLYIDFIKLCVGLHKRKRLRTQIINNLCIQLYKYILVPVCFLLDNLNVNLLFRWCSWVDVLLFRMVKQQMNLSPTSRDYLSSVITAWTTFSWQCQLQTSFLAASLLIDLIVSETLHIGLKKLKYINHNQSFSLDKIQALF